MENPSVLKFFIMLLNIFFSLCLLAVGLFGTSSTSTNRFVANLIDEINRKLDNLASKPLLLQDAPSLGQDFQTLYHADSRDFFNLIFHSQHQFTLPIAVDSVLEILGKRRNLTDHTRILVSILLNNETNVFPIRGILWDLFYQTTNWIEDTAFESTLEAEDRADLIKNISLCYQRLNLLYYRFESMNSSALQKNFNIMEKTRKWWNDAFIMPTLKRYLVFQADPRLSISIFLSRLMGKFQGKQVYDLEPEENCILRNLVKKVLKLGPSEYLPFLAHKDSHFLCLFWYFVYHSTELKFSSCPLRTDYPSLAHSLTNYYSFKKNLKNLVEADHSNRSYVKMIQKKIGQLYTLRDGPL
jgi:hypothetical protein